MDKTPEYAITQGVKSILQAKEVIVIAKGKGKAKAVSDLVNGVFSKPLFYLIIYQLIQFHNMLIFY